MNIFLKEKGTIQHAIPAKRKTKLSDKPGLSELGTVQLDDGELRLNHSFSLKTLLSNVDETFHAT